MNIFQGAHFKNFLIRQFIVSIFILIALFILTTFLLHLNLTTFLALSISTTLCLGGLTFWALKKQPLEWDELESRLMHFQKELSSQNDQMVRTNAQIRALMRGVSNPILIVDQKLKSLFSNPAFRKFFQKGSKLKNQKHLTEWFRNPDLIHAFEECVQQGKSHSLTLDYGGFYFSIALTPLKPKRVSEVYGAVAIFHDITEIKKAENIRKEFVANASHELRTPLTSVKGYTDILVQDLKDKNYGAAELCLQKIQMNTERLSNLVQDLLDLSSLETGQPLEKISLSTEEMTQSIVNQLLERALLKGHKIIRSYETKTVFADPKRLEQVLFNLLDNAIKYSTEKTPIQLSWKQEDNYTVFSILNEGPLISPEHQKRLFERFYRVDKARSRSLGGTGLGLAIVKHIMQRHKGSITIESIHSPTSENALTSFTCSFPNPHSVT